MFKQISPLLAGATLCITMSAAADDKVRLTITRVLPKDKVLPEGSPLAALDQPIVVTGTVDELDVDLPDMLTKHVTTTLGLRTTFEALDAKLKEETELAEKRIRDQKQRGQAAPKADAKPAPVSEPALF